MMVRARRNTRQLMIVWWLFGVSLLPGAEAEAAQSGPMVIDFYTGLAISGFDPVAYLIDHKAQPGLPQYEEKIAGFVWRFQNSGNLEIFRKQPDVYTPRFGGHDPVAASKGFIAPGDPALFLIFENRVYLFQSSESLSTFRRDPQRIASEADHLWPRIVEASQR